MSNGNGVTENGGSNGTAAADISNGRQENGAGDADVMRPAAKKRKTRLPVDLELEYVLGDMPKKVSVESIDIHVYGSVGFTRFHWAIFFFHLASCFIYFPAHPVVQG